MPSIKSYIPSIFISAILAITFNETDQQLLHGSFKALTTILIILIPVLYGPKPRPKYLILGIAALTFCLFGDIFLLNHVYFIWGLVSFLAGHLLFITSFISIGGFKKCYWPLIVLLIYGTAYFIYLLPGLNELAIPVLLYFLVITVMCWQGIGLILSKTTRATRFIALGSILFLVSDSILALNKFSMTFEMARILTLSTYWMAIGLIAIGLSEVEIGAGSMD